jgi:hypothetical protein
MHRVRRKQSIRASVARGRPRDCTNPFMVGCRRQRQFRGTFVPEAEQPIFYRVRGNIRYKFLVIACAEGCLPCPQPAATGAAKAVWIHSLLFGFSLMVLIIGSFEVIAKATDVVRLNILARQFKVDNSGIGCGASGHGDRGEK